MYSPITLDALRVMDAIDRRKSFAAAAEELYRVPSAISYTVNKLEEELQVELFDRSKRKAELTSVGRLILEQGRQILIATEELTALAKQSVQGWEVEITICIDSLINYDPVYELMAEFQELQPRVKVNILEEVLGGSWDALNSRRCDFVIGAPGQAPSTEFQVHHLGDVVFEFAVNQGHPLAELAQPIPLEQINAYPTVVVADSSRNLPVRSTGLLDGQSRITVPSMDKKIAAQISGLGVGYLPMHLIQTQVASGELQLLSLAGYRENTPVHIAWHKGKQGKGVSWFIEKLKGYSFEPVTGLIRSP